MSYPCPHPYLCFLYQPLNPASPHLSMCIHFCVYIYMVIGKTLSSIRLLFSFRFSWQYSSWHLWSDKPKIAIATNILPCSVPVVLPSKYLCVHYNSDLIFYFLCMIFYPIHHVFLQHGQKSYPLRPELIESTYWLYKATRNPRWADLVSIVKWSC